MTDAVSGPASGVPGGYPDRRSTTTRILVCGYRWPELDLPNRRRSQIE